MFSSLPKDARKKVNDIFFPATNITHWLDTPLLMRNAPYFIAFF